MPSVGAPTDKNGYEFDVYRLRGLALFNRYDAEVEQKTGGRVRVEYYLDPAVMLPFLIWPGRLAIDRGVEAKINERNNTWISYSEQNNISFLPCIGMMTDADRVAEAALCGEFLVQKSQRNGRRHNMLPRHWDEFVKRLLHGFDYKSRQRAFSAYQSEQVKSEAQGRESRALHIVYGELCHSVKRYWDVFLGERVGLSPAERGARLSKILHDLESHPITEHAMIMRVMDDSLIEPVQLPFAIVETSEAEKQFWLDLLVGRQKKEGRADSDALCMTQIEHLNASEPDWESPETTILHCLVTGDSKIQSVYLNNKKQEFEGEPDVSNGVDSKFMRNFFLRHPAQFVPTLNQQAMQNAFSDHGLFDKISEALAAVQKVDDDVGMEPEDDADIADIKALTALFAPERRHLHRLKDDMNSSNYDESSELRTSWRDIARSTVYANQRTLAERIDAAQATDQKIKAHGSPDAQAIRAFQVRALDEITTRHTEYAAVTSLQNVAVQMARHTLEPRRGEDLLFGHYRWGRGAYDISNVRAIFTGPPPPRAELVETISNEIRTNSSMVWQIFLLCGLISEDLGDWRKGVWFFKRARDAIRLPVAADVPKVVKCDILYLLARARRVKLSNVNFETALAAQQISLAEAEPLNDELVRARAYSEYGSLHLARLMRLLDRSAGTLERRSALAADERFIESCNMVEQYLRRAIDQTNDSAAGRAIRRQATLNFGLFAMLTVAEPSLFPPTCLVSRQQFKRLSDAAAAEWSEEATQHGVVRLYLMAQQIAATSDPERPAETEASRQLGKIAESLKDSDDDAPFARVVLSAINALTRPV